MNRSKRLKAPQGGAIIETSLVVQVGGPPPLAAEYTGGWFAHRAPPSTRNIPGPRNAPPRNYASGPHMSGQYGWRFSPSGTRRPGTRHTWAEWRAGDARDPDAGDLPPLHSLFGGPGRVRLPPDAHGGADTGASAVPSE